MSCLKQYAHSLIAKHNLYIQQRIIYRLSTESVTCIDAANTWNNFPAYNLQKFFPCVATLLSVHS